MSVGLLYFLQILGAILGFTGCVLCLTGKERLYRAGVGFGIGGIMAMLTLIYAVLFNIASTK